MLQFEEYKVKLNNLKPEIEGLDKALGIEQAKREVEELEIKSSQPGFWTTRRRARRSSPAWARSRARSRRMAGCARCATTC